jgi:hypothetical protein
MTYIDFTLETLQSNFGIAVRDHPLFEPVGDLVPSPWLRESLEDGLSVPIISDKARSEFIVAPILIECRKRLQHRINIFSGIRLDGDPDTGLKGECDFILARSVTTFVLQAPLMLILEAKKNDIDAGLGQCAAQMLGACRNNERVGKPVPYLYGCVTTGQLWQFLKLQQKDLQIHSEIFTIKEMSKILWFLIESLLDVDRQSSSDAA